MTDMAETIAGKIRVKIHQLPLPIFCNFWIEKINSQTFLF